MTFEGYLENKKINAEIFRLAEPERYESLKTIFEQVHPESFTNQKKFLINDLRRKYTLKRE